MKNIRIAHMILSLTIILLQTQVSISFADEKSKDVADAPAVNYCEIWAMDADGRNARKIAHIPDYPIINSPEISPDGTRVAVDGWKTGQRNTDAVILIYDIRTGKVETLGKGCMPTWAPNGKSIALCKYGAERGVYIRSLDGATEVRIDPQGWGIQWSPDGLKLAYTKRGQFIIYTSDNDSWDVISPTGWNYNFIYWNPTWSPDSSKLCFMARADNGPVEFAVVNIEGDEPEVHARFSARGYNPDIAWHPDGKRIVIPQGGAAGQFGRMIEFNPDDVDEDSKQVGIAVKGQPNDRNNGGMSWSRDGKTLYFISRK